MEKVYKIGFFAQRIEKLDSGLKRIGTSSMQLLPEDFKTEKSADKFVKEKEKTFPQDGFDRYFMVFKTLKSKAE